jgi:hypothetical protein
MQQVQQAVSKRKLEMPMILRSTKLSASASRKSTASWRHGSCNQEFRGKSAPISSALPAGSALRGLASPTCRDHAVEGLRPPVLSARNPRNAEWGQRSTDPRLGALDPQRDAALFRPAEREQCHTRDGRGCDCSSSQSHLHGFSPSLHASL